MSYFKRHHLYYLLLAGIFSFLFAVIALAGGTRQMQMLFAMTGAFIYVAFGIFHHMRDHDVSIRIVLEYVAMAVLGISIIYFVFQVQ